MREFTREEEVIIFKALEDYRADCIKVVRTCGPENLSRLAKIIALSDDILYYLAEAGVKAEL